MDTLIDAIVLSLTEKTNLETQIKTLHAELATAKQEIDERAAEVARLQEKDRQRDAELQKVSSAKAVVVEGLHDLMKAHIEEIAELNLSHTNHVAKVKARLANEHEEKLKARDIELERDKAAYRRDFDVPKELRRENERLKVENKALQKKLEGTRSMTQDFNRMKEELATSKKSVVSLRLDLDVAEQKLREKTRQIEALEDKSSRVLESYHSMFGKITELEKAEISTSEKLAASEEKIVSLNKAIWSAQSEYWKLERELKTCDCDTLREANAVLTTRINNMRRGEAMQKPLVQIGVSIRRRFMHKESATGVRLENVPAYVQEGNDAAHSRNSAADLAVFNIGCFRESSDGHLFEKIYGAKPAEYTNDMAKWQRFLCAQTKFKAVEASNLTAYNRADSLHYWLKTRGIQDGVTSPHWRKTSDDYLDEFEKLVNSDEIHDSDPIYDSSKSSESE